MILKEASRQFIFHLCKKKGFYHVINQLDTAGGLFDFYQLEKKQKLKRIYLSQHTISYRYFSCIIKDSLHPTQLQRHHWSILFALLHAALLLFTIRAVHTSQTRIRRRYKKKNHKNPYNFFNEKYYVIDMINPSSVPMSSVSATTRKIDPSFYVIFTS